MKISKFFGGPNFRNFKTRFSRKFSGKHQNNPLTSIIFKDEYDDHKIKKIGKKIRKFLKFSKVGPSPKKFFFQNLKILVSFCRELFAEYCGANSLIIKVN